jgi:thiol-disulfide isomerase/thioredoxin
LAPMQAERRKNFRCPPGSDAESVVLRLNGVDRTVKIVNISAEGFRVSFEVDGGIEPAKIGDIALLGTRNGSHQVRVANLHFEDRPSETTTVQVGLERLADFSRPTSRARKLDPSKGAVGGGRRSGNPSSSMLVKVGLVAAIALLGIVGINLTLTARGNSNGHSVAHASKGGETQPAPPADPAAPETKTFQEPPEREQALVDPKFDASLKIVAALKRATRENKSVVVEFGTDKCESCYRLRDFIAKNAEFAAAFQRDFVLVVVDKAANQSLFNRLVPNERQKESSFFTLLDKEGRTVKGETTDKVAAGSGFDINKIKALLQPAPQKE